MTVYRTFALNVVAAGVPSWATGATLNVWTAVSGTQLAGTGKPFCSWPFGAVPGTTGFVRYSGTGGNIGNTGVFAYSGAAFDQASATVWSAANGGHDDYYGNEVYKLDLRSESPAWSLVKNPTQNVTVENAGNAADNGYNTFDGSPISRHSYWCPWYDRHSARVLLLGVIAGQGIAKMHRNVDAFNPATNAWDTTTWPDVPVQAISNNDNTAYMDADGDVVLIDTNNTSSANAARLNLSGVKGTQGTWTTLPNNIGAIRYGSAVAYNSNTNRVFCPHLFGGGAAIFDPTNNHAKSTVTLTGATAAYTAAIAAGGQDRVAATFDPVANAYIVLPWFQPKTFKIDATTYAVTEIGTMPSVGGGVGTSFRAYGNFTYSTFLGGVVFVTEERTANVHFLRTH